MTFLRKLHNFWTGKRGKNLLEPQTEVVAGYTSRLDDTDGTLHFTIFPASGGKVAQVVTYDRQRDKTHTRLYIIADTSDLGAELGEIITREALSR